ncbi:MAG: hypothetical protein FJ098_14180 [Deltaproteobacteria bacterium]|nr:hypothetical protein [Deltaproteobacteria bacterium]
MDHTATVIYDGDEVTTWNLDVAVFVAACGLPYVDARRVGKGKHEIVFHDPRRAFRALEMLYNNGGAIAANRLMAVQRDLKSFMRRKDLESESERPSGNRGRSQVEVRPMRTPPRRR